MTRARKSKEQQEPDLSTYDDNSDVRTSDLVEALERMRNTDSFGLDFERMGSDE